MKRIFVFFLLFVFTMPVYAADADTVNGLPPCNSYDNAIYREVYKNFSEESFGRVRKGENGNFFVTIGGTPMEFAIEENSIVMIGLQDNTAHQELGDIGEMADYGFESPVDAITTETESSDATESSTNDYSIFTPDEDTPDLPSFGEPITEPSEPTSEAATEATSEAATKPTSVAEVVLPNGESPEVGTQQPTAFAISDEIFAGGDNMAAKIAMEAFHAAADETSRLRFERWIATRPMIATMQQSGDTLTGTVKGIVNEYDITINADGTITMEDTAWMEFPQWSAFKR